MGKKLGLVLLLVNMLAVIGVLGLFVYTQLIFKRPAITESGQRKKLQKEYSKKKADAVKTLINIDPMTANLDTFTENGKESSHYASISMTIELRDEEEKARFDQFKPMILDRILTILGKKKFNDLNQVQGRYVFRSQIIDGANEILGIPMVNEVYFTDFLLQ